MQSKECSKCGEIKELSEYNRDGVYRRGECKLCSRAAGKIYRLSESPQSARGRSARYRKTQKAKDADKRYREKNALQISARNAVTHEVEAGRLSNIKTVKCNGCGNSADHYHHHNGYDKKQWLDVVPLCVSCHTKAHGES